MNNESEKFCKVRETCVVLSDEVCGNTSFSASSGVISTMRLPFRYPKRVKCFYSIDSGYVNSVAISIDRLSFEYVHYVDRSCKSGWLSVSVQINVSFSIPVIIRYRCNSSIWGPFNGLCEIVISYGTYM